MRKITLQNPDEMYTDENAGLMATLTSSSETFPFEKEAGTFDEYTKQVKSWNLVYLN
jgi:hypothetical protein